MIEYMQNKKLGKSLIILCTCTSTVEFADNVYYRNDQLKKYNNRLIVKSCDSTRLKMVYNNYNI